MFPFQKYRTIERFVSSIDFLGSINLLLVPLQKFSLRDEFCFQSAQQTRSRHFITDNKEDCDSSTSTSLAWRAARIPPMATPVSLNCHDGNTQRTNSHSDVEKNRYDWKHQIRFFLAAFFFFSRCQFELIWCWWVPSTRTSISYRKCSLKPWYEVMDRTSNPSEFHRFCKVYRSSWGWG